MTSLSFRFLTLCVFLVCWSTTVFAQGRTPRKPTDRPNVVIIFADDLGYGDLQCFGHPTIKTPHMNKMAAEGMRFTSFYVAAPVCTPSRAALLTGRLPVRTGMCHDSRRVLFPDSAGGLPESELTIAELLKTAGYTTACIGKWHLGHLPQYLPTSQGFDSYFGIPYSNDMDRVADRKKGRNIFLNPKVKYWNVPLMRDEKITERPADQTTITKRYTEEAVKFIRKNKNEPFFLYLAHNMPHVPLFASKNFQGHSKRGLYGDVIEEIDWSVGQILDTLRAEGLAENTLVIFTSDNGPWLIFGAHGGSAGLLRDGKGSTFEGGMRVPGIMWWPGQIRGGTVTSEMASTLDVLPTVASISGAKLPKHRNLDGHDLSSFLRGKGPSPRQSMFFYRGTKLYAVRKGAFKAHFYTKPAYGGGKEMAHNPPLIYNLDIDPSEKYNIAKSNADVIADLTKLANDHKSSMKPGEDQLGKRLPKMSRENFSKPQSLFSDTRFHQSTFISTAFSITPPEAIMTSVVGTGKKGYSGDGGPATKATLNQPFHCAFDKHGNLYIAEANNHCIRKMDRKTGFLSTVAGCGKKGYSGDGGPATKATMNEPYAVVVDDDMNLYIVDRLNAVIRKVDGKTKRISTIAGTGKKGYSGDGGPATEAKLTEPNDCYLDGRGGLLIADVRDWRIRRVDLKSGVISTFAGTGRPKGKVNAKAIKEKGDGGPATKALIVGARAVCVDGKGNTYICEREGSSIRKVDPKGIITTIGGTGKWGYSGDGGLALKALYKGPKAIRCDKYGNIYIVDTENHAIRKIDIKTGISSTVAGGQRSPKDGPATKAGLARPHGCVIDDDGTIFIADSENHRIRRVTFLDE